jgi:PAS domain S-box-containing protein
MRHADALLQALPDGVCLVGADGRIVEVNDRLCAMTGYDAHELLGAKPPYPYWAPEHVDAIVAAFDEGMHRDASTYTELPFRRRDGEDFQVSVTICRLPGGEGFACLLREVTAEVRERARLLEAHRVAQLVSFDHDLATGTVALVGDLGDVADVPLGDPPTLDELFALVLAPYDATLRAALEGAASAGHAAVCEVAVATAGGAARWLEFRLHPVRVAGGRVARIAGTAQDVTSRKLAELAHTQSEERLRQAQRVAGIGSFEVDYRTGRVAWSEELHRLFGFTAEHLEHTLEAARALLPAEESAALRALGERTVNDGQPRGVGHEYLRRGELRSSDVRVEALTDQEGRPYGVRGTLQDVTERRRAEREIHLQAHLLDAVDVAIIATDLHGTITHFNRGAERLLRLAPEDAVGLPVTRLTTEDREESALARLGARIRRDGQWEGDVEVSRRDGSRFPAHVHAALVRDEAGEPTGVAGVCVDMTDRVESERRLRAASAYQRAITDSMGEGLYTVDVEGRLMYMNRAAEELLGWTSDELTGRIMHEVAHHHRPDGTQYPLHECPTVRARADGHLVRSKDDLFFRKDGSELPVDFSTAPFETADGVRGSVVVFSDVTERKAAQLLLEAQLESATWAGRVRDALDADRFVLHAQPIVSLADGSTVQHELLIRMLDERDGIIPPGRFLPTAEETGLIVDIDRWVAHEAIALAAAGHAVELNLSARSLAAPGMLDHIRDELRATGADPSLLVVELTETALITDAAAAERFIAGLRDLGCGLALDDFGTGYGGFTYLKRLPIDYLKIDMEFVRDLTHSTASQEVVRAVVSLARGFGQRTVAEGVEDADTMALLRELGVDLAQGYVIARPAPLDDVFAAVP